MPDPDKIHSFVINNCTSPNPKSKKETTQNFWSPDIPKIFLIKVHNNWHQFIYMLISSVCFLGHPIEMKRIVQSLLMHYPNIILDTQH